MPDGQPMRLATAVAMTECVIMRLQKETMVRVIHEETAFSAFFVSHLLTRTIRVESDLVDQLFNSSEKRLARALLLLANFGKEGRPEPIIAKISQETLAEMIGTTRSRVSFFMNNLEKALLLQRSYRNSQIIAECRVGRGATYPTPEARQKALRIVMSVLSKTTWQPPCVSISSCPIAEIGRYGDNPFIALAASRSANYLLLTSFVSQWPIKMAAA